MKWHWTSWQKLQRKETQRSIEREKKKEEERGAGKRGKGMEFGDERNSG